jgi:hypothetical protein
MAAGRFYCRCQWPIGFADISVHHRRHRAGLLDRTCSRTRAVITRPWEAFVYVKLHVLRANGLATISLGCTSFSKLSASTSQGCLAGRLLAERSGGPRIACGLDSIARSSIGHSLGKLFLAASFGMVSVQCQCIERKRSAPFRASFAADVM